MEITEGEVDDYESLPESSSMTTHMAAGALAGIMEHCVMYPVDCIKTRMMCLKPNPKANYRHMLDAFYTISRDEGLKRTTRGISAVIGGAGPAHAMYFACYEKLKRTFSGTQQGNPLANGLAGCFATLLHDAVMNPADVIKQRMQMYNSPYKSCSNCFLTIYKKEGIRAFYRSYTTQLTMNIPFQSIHFVTYEIMQDFLNKDRQYNPSSHMISGGVAGAVAAAVTTPLDVVKTLLNTQEHLKEINGKSNSVNGMFSAFKRVHTCCGNSGYFKGLQARVIYQIPSTGLSWSVYEFFKYIITKRKNKDDYQTLEGESHAETTEKIKSLLPPAVTYAATDKK